ncbi:MAG: hypothetical protein ACREI8_11095, partial [Myxococcota bacterium]
MPKRAAWIGLGIASALACASAPPLTRPAATPQAFCFRQLIAIAQLDDESARRAAEDALVDVLVTQPAAVRGLQVVASYTLFSDRELEDAALLRAQLEAAGFDGAVVLRRVSDDRIEASIYSVSREAPLWSGVSGTLGPDDARERVDELAHA